MHNLLPYLRSNGWTPLFGAGRDPEHDPLALLKGPPASVGLNDLALSWRGQTLLAPGELTAGEGGPSRGAAPGNIVLAEGAGQHDATGLPVQMVQSETAAAAFGDATPAYAPPVRRWQRRVVFGCGGLLVVDDVLAAAPVRWQWLFHLPQPPRLGLHARRFDIASGPAAASFYLLAPVGLRTRVEDSPRLHRVAVETTQRTLQARFIWAALLHDPDQPSSPKRLRDEALVGLRWDTPDGPRILAAKIDDASAAPWPGTAALLHPNGESLISI